MRDPAQQQLSVVVALAIALSLLATAAVAVAPRAHAQTECTAAIDFMLVLDGSESISAEDFDAMRTFAGGLIGHFAVGPDDAQAGIVQFASEGQGVVEIGLSGDSTAIDAAISGMTQLIGATDIQEGIALGQGELTARGRADVPRVMIVLTDGEHNQPGDPVAEAEAAKAAGTEIFAIAVGPGPDMAQLSAIASDPDAEHIFAVSAFDELATILEPLVVVVCPPTPEPTAEPPATPYGPPVLGEGPNPPPDVLLPPETGVGGGAAAANGAGQALALALGGVLVAFMLGTATFAVMRR